MSRIACPSEAWDRYSEQEDQVAEEHYWYELANKIDEDIYEYSTKERTAFRKGVQAMFTAIQQKHQSIYSEYQADRVDPEDAWESMCDILDDLEPDFKI